MRIQRVEDFKNVTGVSVAGKIKRYSCLEYIAIENTSGNSFLLKVGTTPGGNDLYEGEIEGVNNTVTINAYFSASANIYLSWGGIMMPFVAVVWKDLDAVEFNSIPKEPYNGGGSNSDNSPGICFRRKRKDPHTIVELFGQVVARVSTCITPRLQLIDPMITGVHYEHGHPVEVIETLKQKDQSVSQRFSKYPIIALFQDFPERTGNDIGLQSEVSLHVIIARATKAEYKANERYDYNFHPVLYPIYAELFRQIHWHKAFLTKSPDLITHTKWDRLYWGREGLWKNEGNIFNDMIDCIELRDLKLKVNLKLC